MKPEPKLPKDHWLFYVDDGKDWRWSRTGTNGRVVSQSHRGFRVRAECEDDAARNGWNGPSVSHFRWAR